MILRTYFPLLQRSNTTACRRQMRVVVKPYFPFLLLPTHLTLFITQCGGGSTRHNRRSGWTKCNRRRVRQSVGRSVGKVRSIHLIAFLSWLHGDKPHGGLLRSIADSALLPNHTSHSFHSSHYPHTTHFLSRSVEAEAPATIDEVGGRSVTDEECDEV